MTFTQFSNATLHLLHADIAGLIGACGLPTPLSEASLYAMTNGGKRVRPLLVAATYLTLQPELASTLATLNAQDYYLPSSVRRAMLAVECLHGYSLVHDDLPCMDDDDLRRGRPTTHIAYGEAVALLAGDVLQTLAFEAFTHVYFGYDEFVKKPPKATFYPAPTVPLLQMNPLDYPDLASMRNIGDASLSKFDSELSLDDSASGTTSMPITITIDKAPALLAIFAPRARRMVMGQMLDVTGEAQQLNQEELEALHRDKTGALIEASVLMGALCGNATPPQMAALQVFAQNIGLAFQVQDDILDVTATTETLGKPAGSDEKLNKSTYVKLLGATAATNYANDLFNTAKMAIIEQFGEKNLLMDLANWLWARQK